MTPDRFALFARIKGDLSQARTGSVLPVDERHILDVLPHHWREDADTIEEWFIRYCRALGLHATYDGMRRCYHVRLTKDAADEATITWPTRHCHHKSDTMFIAFELGLAGSTCRIAVYPLSWCIFVQHDRKHPKYPTNMAFGPLRLTLHSVQSR